MDVLGLEQFLDEADFVCFQRICPVATDVLLRKKIRKYLTAFMAEKRMLMIGSTAMVLSIVANSSGHGSRL